MEVDAAGYCQGCGTYRGAPGYDAGGQYGFQASAPPYGGQPSGPPYQGQPSGPPYQPSGPPYQADPYQQGYQQQQAYGAYTDPNYPPSFAPPPPPGRRPSTVPLIVLSVIAVFLVAGIITVVLVRAGGDEPTNDPTTAPPTPGPTDTVAAGLDKCVVGTWRVTSAREKVDLDGKLVEFTASGGTAEFRGDGTGTFDYGSSGLVYRGTVEGQPVTITLTGKASFSYKTTDNTITYSNPSADGEAVLKVNGVVTTTIPLDMDTKPNSYTCSGSSMTLTTDLATTELRK
jgi:hypothetical protein